MKKRYCKPDSGGTPTFAELADWLVIMSNAGAKCARCNMRACALVPTEGKYSGPVGNVRAFLDWAAPRAASRNGVEPRCIACCFNGSFRGVHPDWLRLKLGREMFNRQKLIARYVSSCAHLYLNRSDLKKAIINVCQQVEQLRLAQPRPNRSEMARGNRMASSGTRSKSVDYMARRLGEIHRLVRTISTHCYWCETKPEEVTKDCVFAVPFDHSSRAGLFRCIQFYEGMWALGLLVPACYRCNLERGQREAAARAWLQRVETGFAIFVPHAEPKRFLIPKPEAVMADGTQQARFA